MGADIGMLEAVAIIHCIVLMLSSLIKALRVVLVIAHCQIMANITRGTAGELDSIKSTHIRVRIVVKM